MEKPAAGRFSLQSFLPYHLHTVSAQIMQLTTRRYAELLGITVAEGRVLTAVTSFGPLSTHNIAYHTRMDKAKISRAIKSLVTRGWILRRLNPQDNRLIMLTLTPAGEEALDAIVPIITAIEDEMIAAIGEPARTEIMALLIKIEQRLDQSLLTPRKSKRKK